MFGLRTPELLIILVLVLVLFGGNRVAQLGSSLGQGIRNFKRGFNGEDGGEAPPSSLSQGNPNTSATAPRQPANSNRDV